MKNFGRPGQFLKVWKKIRNVREKISGKTYRKKSRGSKILATRGRGDFVKFYLAPPSKMRVAPQMPPPPNSETWRRHWQREQSTGQIVWPKPNWWLLFVLLYSNGGWQLANMLLMTSDLRLSCIMMFDFEPRSSKLKEISFVLFFFTVWLLYSVRSKFGQHNAQPEVGDKNGRSRQCAWFHRSISELLGRCSDIINRTNGQ